VAASRIHLISNRTLPAESLTATSLGKALGQEVLAALPYMEDRFSLANVLRAPLDLRFPEERVTLAASLRSGPRLPCRIWQRECSKCSRLPAALHASEATTRRLRAARRRTPTTKVPNG